MPLTKRPRGVNLFREISGVYYFWNEAVCIFNNGMLLDINKDKVRILKVMKIGKFSPKKKKWLLWQQHLSEYLENRST